MTHLFATAELFAELQRRGWFPGWLALLLGLAAVAAVGVLYAFEAGRLGPLRRLALAGVRVAVVGAVAFLLLRPTWVSERSGERPRPVAVLIDVSQSMDQRDPRPDPADQWRAALAFDLLEPNKPFPADAFATAVAGRLPDRPSRFEVASRALTNPRLDLVGRLKGVGPVEVSTFGGVRSGGKDPGLGWLADQKPDQPRTALVACALELLNRDEADAPAAVVVVTDGRENGGDKTLAELAEKYRERKIPLHIYGVGSSSFGQLRLRDAGVPESVFLDDIVRVPVRYAVRGVPRGRVDIVVRFGGDEVAAKRNIPVREGDDVREVLSFVPGPREAAAKKQEVTVTVTVRPEGGGVALDALTDSVTKPSQVVSKKLQVLVVEGLPRKDFQFLMRALQRDRRVEARFFLTEGDREAMRLGDPWVAEFARQLNGTLALEREEFRKLINKYDLLIIGDVPGKFFSPEHQQVVKEFVAEGGGLIHIAGKVHAPREWLGGDRGRASIADVLPVEAEPLAFKVRLPDERYYQPLEDRPYRPFVPALAPGAARSPLVALEDDPLDNAGLWGRAPRAEADDAPPPGPDRGGRGKQLQPLEWYYPVTRLKPGAEPFLVHPTARTPGPDGRPMPLLAGHYYGKGYVLFSAFDDTWKWRFNEADRYFGRFWSQCVYQAGVPRMVGTKLTQVSLDTLEPVQGKSGQVYARVLDENFKAYTAEEIDATLQRLPEKENDDVGPPTPVKLQKLHGQDGEYVAPLPFNQAGRFKLTVSPNNKSPAALEYRVSLPPDHEQAPGGLAEGEMRALAAESGAADRPGKFYREEDLYRLPDEVKPQTAAFSRREETVLWNRWAMLLLIGLMSAEWFLRKFSGLS